MSQTAGVVDGDGHVCEPPDLWSSRLPAHLRERGIRLRWNADTGYDEATVEGRLLTDRGLVGLGNAGTPFEDLGRGIHYEDIAPAGFDPRRRLAVLDAEGIDAAVMYPGLGLSLPAIQDPELAVWSCRVYNDWIAEYCAADPTRLIGIAALPLQDPAALASSPNCASTRRTWTRRHGRSCSGSTRCVCTGSKTFTAEAQRRGDDLRGM